MSFRKRNMVINTPASAQGSPSKAEKVTIPGVRPSPLDGRPTTSTGTASLDTLLAGHAGFPLGTSLLVEEHGTTDFANVLLRYYAAEGLVQGHQVHILGMHKGWKAELPGVTTETSSSSKSETAAGDKMKIAWRYESLSSAGAPRDRQAPQKPTTPGSEPVSIFCHNFDLTKRLSPGDIKGQIGFHPSMIMPKLSAKPNDITPSSLRLFINDITTKISNAPPSMMHRIIVPSLLSPTLYPSSLARPEEVLQFLHSLRALLRQYASRVTAIVTLPLTLYPRTSGFVRWMELLSDGVIELVPLQLNAVHAPPPGAKSDSKSDEQMQGLLRVHSLPVYHEKGGGSSDGHARDDLSFSLSRSRGLIVKPFSLPPADGDEPEKKPADATKPNMEF
ncbi:Elongator complex protein 4 [Apiospora arundinis]|uniref:Elongator complex protein 4 n=1 Tax=Apiospora arundinis TaxID=335852 RepID=A0ABR2ISF1_9PEZI